MIALEHIIQDPGAQVPVVQDPVDEFGQLTVLASTFDHVDGLFYFTLVVCIFFFLLITGILGYSVVKYRRRTIDQPAASNVTHNTTLEVVWTVIPLIIVMVIFAWGWKGSLDMTVVPADAKQYKIVAKRWNWTFFYPEYPVPSTNELWVEVGKPVAFTMESTDVLHSFYVPSMRVKRDVVPGRYMQTWFHPTRLGTFNLFCTEYCGLDHSRMIGKVHVVTAEEYAKHPWDEWDPNDLVGGGEKLYQLNCKSCHSIDGTRVVGPSFKNLWGREERVAVYPNGQQIADPEIRTVTVDEEYVIDSVRNPQHMIVQAPEGQAPYPFTGMNAFGPDVIPDNRLQGIIEYLKSLSDGN